MPQASIIHEPSFLETLRASESVEETRAEHLKNQVSWSRAYRTLEKAGRRPTPYDFDEIWPWVPMLTVDHKRKLVTKSRKVTYTEQLIDFIWWRLDSNPGTNAAYIRETQQAANLLMRERVEPSLRDPRNPFRNRIAYNQTEAKSFRPYDPSSYKDQYLYAVGTKTTASIKQAGDKMRGPELTTVAYDERQLQPVEMEGVIQGALPLDQVLHTMTGGTPTVAGNILGRLWDNSSQHTLLFRCPDCWADRTRRNFDGWQELRRSNICNYDDLEKCYVGCIRCGTSLEWMRGNYGNVPHPESGVIGKVEWVPQKFYPPGDKRAGLPFTKHYLGFRIDRFCVSLAPLAEPYCGRPEGSTRKIVEDLEDVNTTKREKENEVLGRVYVGGDAPFSQGKMEGCCVRHLDFDEARRIHYPIRVLNYDWGVYTTWKVNGITSDGRCVALAWGKIKSDEHYHGQELIKIGIEYQVDWVVGDKGYAAGREIDLIAKWKRRAVSVWYVPNEKRSSHPKHRIVWVKGENIAIVDRNFVIETLADAVERGTNALIIPAKQWDKASDLITEYAHVINKGAPDPREMGYELEIKQEQDRWMKTGADHYLHCDVYLMVTRYLIRPSDGCVGVRNRYGKRGRSLYDEPEAA